MAATEQDLAEKMQQMTAHLMQVLQPYETLLQTAARRGKKTYDITFDRDFPGFCDTSREKPYSFRTEIPLRCEGELAGTVYVIGFCPGDGTGAESDRFKLDNLIIPEKYRFDIKPEKVIPRPKAPKVTSEIMFPFFSLDGKTGEAYNHIVCLEELTVRRNEIKVSSDGPDAYILKREFFLGMPSQSDYLQALRSNSGHIRPQLYFTTGYNPSGSRFGDPHAIVCTDMGAGENIIQVAGFLSAPSAMNFFTSIFDNLKEKGHLAVPKKCD